MGDQDKIATLLRLAASVTQLQAAQDVAAQKLLKYDGEKFPSDGCAITLSVLLQDAGIDVADTYTAFDLGKLLKDNRNWIAVPVGEQKAGDIGSTCGSAPQHGVDHIYLVLQPVNSDEMIIADNQSPRPHFRYASGLGGKSPTRFFLRASS